MNDDTLITIREIPVGTPRRACRTDGAPADFILSGFEIGSGSESDEVHVCYLHVGDAVRLITADAGA